MLSFGRLSLAALLFTVTFFFEYCPPFKRVQIPFDLSWYHYPLADYAFEALRGWHLPQWDPSIYCGLSFAGNVQAGLFYPPKWLMFLASAGAQKLHYSTLEYFVFGHVWLGFVLCWFWLGRVRGLHPVAAILGSGIFAFSGFVLLDLQHLGLICGYAWMPLGFASIDQAATARVWNPLWKLSLAFSMCVLSGYPPMWVVFCVCMAAYAAALESSARRLIGATAAMAFALPVCAIQLVPALEATRLKIPEIKYGPSSGVKDPRFYISFITPNYFDFGLNVDIHKNPGKEYLYLGASALVGLGILVFKRKPLRKAASSGAVLFVSLIFLTNPFGLLGRAVEGSFLAQVFTDWYFLAGITAGVAGLAAIGLDAYLQRDQEPWPAGFTGVIPIVTLLWAVRLIFVWSTSGTFWALWRSGVDSLVGVILCGSCMVAYSRSRARLRLLAGLALLALASAEYKAFGSSKRFNAEPYQRSSQIADSPYPGMNSSVYRSMREHPEYRMAVEVTGPDPLYLRCVGLTTPQGFDPYMPKAYRALADGVATRVDDRQFTIDPQNEAALKLFGVRYFGTSENGPLYSRLRASPRFRVLQPDDSYFKLFEFAGADPAIAWERPSVGDSVNSLVWKPERRVVTVYSSTGGVLRFAEQYFPGWKAKVDGRDQDIRRCHDALQCVTLNPGSHTVEFDYQSRSIVQGAWISSASLALATIVTIISRRKKPRVAF
jgi:hypothetical protein